MLGEYECSNCHADISETTKECPKCKAHISGDEFFKNEEKIKDKEYFTECECFDCRIRKEFKTVVGIYRLFECPECKTAMFVNRTFQIIDGKKEIILDLEKGD